MRAIICGGRDFKDWQHFMTVMERSPTITFIISGAATGADTMAIEYAKMFDIDYKVYMADWQKHGRAAGPIRNQHMLDDGKPDIVIAMPGGKGTKDMIARAVLAGIHVYT